MKEAKTIGEKIALARFLKGRLSQGIVGEKIGVSQTLMSFYEDGTRPIPKDKAIALSNLLEIPIEEFQKGA